MGQGIVWYFNYHIIPRTKEKDPADELKNNRYIFKETFHEILTFLSLIIKLITLLYYVGKWDKCDIHVRIYIEILMRAQRD